MRRTHGEEGAHTRREPVDFLAVPWMFSESLSFCLGDLFLRDDNGAF